MNHTYPPHKSGERRGKARAQNHPQVHKQTHTQVPTLNVPLEGTFATLIPELRKAVASQLYTIPTPIQEQCIPPLLAGRDLIGCAQTGTGKTAAFSLPLLQRLSPNSGSNSSPHAQQDDQDNLRHPHQGHQNHKGPQDDLRRDDKGHQNHKGPQDDLRRDDKGHQDDHKCAHRHERTPRPRQGNPRALIIAPTRELAAQIAKSIDTYGRFLTLRHGVVFGGVNQTSQVRTLNRGVDILVATPGRLLDLMGQGHIRLESIEVLVLDEVDKMLDMGFLPDIKQILAKVPEQRQTMFFSATLSAEIKQLAMGMVKNPVEITISPEKPTVESIDQRLLYVDKGDKDALLVSQLKAPEMGKAIIFTQMKHMANRVTAKLLSAGIPSAAIHGNKSQGARTKALADFKNGTINVMVATDVAARGIDVDNITHVFNYDLPLEAETYVHRIGRTARAGLSGSAVSFCSPEEKAYLKMIERLLGKPVPPQLDHDFHSDEALRSSLPAPKNFGRGQNRGAPGKRDSTGDRNSSGGGKGRGRNGDSGKGGGSRPASSGGRKDRQKDHPRGFHSRGRG